MELKLHLVSASKYQEFTLDSKAASFLEAGNKAQRLLQPHQKSAKLRTEKLVFVTSDQLFVAMHSKTSPDTREKRQGEQEDSNSKANLLT